MYQQVTCLHGSRPPEDLLPQRARGQGSSLGSSHPRQQIRDSTHKARIFPGQSVNLKQFLKRFFSLGNYEDRKEIG